MTENMMENTRKALFALIPWNGSFLAVLTRPADHAPEPARPDPSARLQTGMLR